MSHDKIWYLQILDAQPYNGLVRIIWRQYAYAPKNEQDDGIRHYSTLMVSIDHSKGRRKEKKTMGGFGWMVGWILSWRSA